MALSRIQSACEQVEAPGLAVVDPSPSSWLPTESTLTKREARPVGRSHQWLPAWTAAAAVVRPADHSLPTERRSCQESRILRCYPSRGRVLPLGVATLEGWAKCTRGALSGGGEAGVRTHGPQGRSTREHAYRVRTPFEREITVCHAVATTLWLSEWGEAASRLDGDPHGCDVVPKPDSSLVA